MLDSLWQDSRHAIRALRNEPGFATVAALSLALGIGANTAIFSLIDAVMLKTLPVGHPEELLQVTAGGAGHECLCHTDATLRGVGFGLGNAKALLAHDFVGLLDGLGEDVEKRADADALEDHAALVFVRFDGVIDAVVGEGGFQAQGVLESPRDVDEIQFAVSKKVSVAAHSHSSYRDLLR